MKPWTSPLCPKMHPLPMLKWLQTIPNTHKWSSIYRFRNSWTSIAKRATTNLQQKHIMEFASFGVWTISTSKSEAWRKKPQAALYLPFWFQIYFGDVNETPLNSDIMIAIVLFPTINDSKIPRPSCGSETPSSSFAAHPQLLNAPSPLPAPPQWGT